MAEEENCQVVEEIEDEQEPLPRPNPNAPAKYVEYEGYAIQQTKEGLWFYRRAIRGKPTTFVCTCEQALRKGLDPDATAEALKKEKKGQNTKTAPVKPAPKKVASTPAVPTTAVQSPLPVYKAPPAVKPQFTNKRPVEDVQSIDRTEFYFNSLNSTLNVLIQHLIENEKRRTMTELLIEKNNTALYDLNNVLANAAQDYSKGIQLLIQIIDTLKTMQPPKILRPPSPPAKKQKLIASNLKNKASDTEELFDLDPPPKHKNLEDNPGMRRVIALDQKEEASDGDDILDFDFQKKAFRELKKK